MSLFRTFQATCPACGLRTPYELVHSVNADRRPDLRDEIVAARFQTVTCAGCGEAFRVEPEFSYLHIGAGQFIAAWPSSELMHWDQVEKRSIETFDRLFGTEATPEAATIGQELTTRTVFGWGALREKIVARETGIDDVTLEMAKLLLLRDPNGGSELDVSAELRLIEVNSARQMVFGRFDVTGQKLSETITVPRALIDEIEGDAESWQELRADLDAGPFVDLTRLTVAPVPAD